MNSRGHIWLLLSLLVLAIGAFVIWPRTDADQFGGPTLTVRGVNWIAGNEVRDETDGSWRLQADLAFAGPTKGSSPMHGHIIIHQGNAAVLPS